MSAIQSLLLVLESAEKERDVARTALAAARQSHESARQQAQSLHDWRMDYQRRWQAQFRQSGGVEIVRCYQDFMQRLGDAESDQGLRVGQAQQQEARARALLIERERRVVALSQLIDRRQVELMHKQARQDQKASDEMAARIVRLQQSQGAFSTGLANGAI